MAIDKQFVVNLRGKEYPLWAGVLDAATQAGLKSLTTRVIQIPSADNGQLAVVMATAVFDDGRVFEDVGDCSPQSTAPHLAAAALRLASTRAKGRCLRDSINVGQTMFEELPEDERTGEPQWKAKEPDARPSDPERAHPPRTAGDAPMACSAEGCGKPLTKGQYEISLRNMGAPFCPTHQRSERKAG